MEKSKKRNTLMNRVRYLLFGEDMVPEQIMPEPLFEDAPLRKKDARYGPLRKKAEESESWAEENNNPVKRVEEYCIAARNYLKVGEGKDALRNYGKARKYLEKITASTEGDEKRRYSAQLKKIDENIRRIEKVRRRDWHGLDERVWSNYAKAAVFIGIIGGALFLSRNITGNVISNLSTSTSNAIGSAFIILGLVGAFFWIKSKKQ